MVWRAILGIVPMLLIGLFATGAIPLSSVWPGAASVVGEREQLGPVRNGRERAAEAIGQIYGVRPDQVSLMKEEMREMEKERGQAERRSEHRRAGWAPDSGGWGRPN